MHKAILLLLPTVVFGQPAARPVPIDNTYVKVVDARDRPHVRGALHDHKMDRVMVYLTKCDLRLVDQAGKVEEQHWKPGDVAWSPARSVPHTSENVSDTPCRVVEVELKPGSGRTPVAAGPLDPVKVDPKHYKVEIDNEKVRVLRARYGPGETGALHQHDRDRVTVFLTDSELEITSPEGKREVRRGKQFDISWGTVAKHQEKNLARSAFEVIAVELKAR